MKLLDGLKKKEIGYLLLGLAAACIIAWVLVYAPAIRELKRLKAEVAVRQDAMAESMRQWSDMRRSKGGETQGWEASVRRWDERVPGTPMADALMAEISAQAVRHGLTVFRLTLPAEGAEENAMAGVPAGGDPAQDNVDRPVEQKYEIVFRSSYRDLAGFLDELPHLRRLITLRALQVREDEGAMESKLSISAWHRGKP
ncbi:MAG TPA: hypothetical protein VGK27_01040 [Candidatus Deferrimicrobiaceae bacterium]|jgi:hypothetical protein